MEQFMYKSYFTIIIQVTHYVYADNNYSITQTDGVYKYNMCVNMCFILIAS